MSHLEKEFLSIKRTISFTNMFEEIKTSGKLSAEELKKLEDIWNFTMDGKHWMDPDLSQCCRVAEKAVKENYDLSDEFIRTIVNIAAFQWK
ncbi:MAG: hypothetical protein ABIP51_10685 [Bacteroidia bacterium]